LFCESAVGERGSEDQKSKVSPTLIARIGWRGNHAAMPYVLSKGGWRSQASKRRTERGTLADNTSLRSNPVETPKISGGDESDVELPLRERAC